MSMYKREYQFGNYLIRLMERIGRTAHPVSGLKKKTKKSSVWWESMKISTRRLMR